MRKWIIPLIIILVTIQIVTALDLCSREMTPSDIPCMITSTWSYTNNCGNYTIKIYNETPALISTMTMDNYSVTGRCNITFNYTKHGSYTLNSTSGDTWDVIVEADEMAYITIGIMLGIITFIFAFLSVKIKHWAGQIFLSIFTLLMIVYDFFISARIIETIESAETGIVQTLDTIFFLATQLFRLALLFAGIYILYYMWKYVLLAPLRKRERRENEDLYD